MPFELSPHLECSATLLQTIILQWFCGIVFAGFMGAAVALAVALAIRSKP